MSNSDLGLPEIKIDSASLYREDVFTDRRAGTLRRTDRCQAPSWLGGLSRP